MAFVSAGIVASVLDWSHELKPIIKHSSTVVVMVGIIGSVLLSKPRIVEASNGSEPSCPSILTIIAPVRLLESMSTV